MLGHALSSLESAFGEIRAMYRNDRFSRVFALTVICLNILVITVPFAIEALRSVGISRYDLPARLNITRDGSLPEMFNYGQAALCALFLFGIWLRTREHMFLAWSLIFSFVTLDDATRFHERGGLLLAATFDLVSLPGMRARDTGEIITWSSVALGLLAPLLWSFWQSRPRQQALGSVFLLLFACLVGFAVVVDMLHFLTGSKLVGYAEDGGEMLSIAVACCCAFILYRGLGRDADLQALDPTLPFSKRT
ncbi:MAG: hypothetical protein EOR08_13865 [Mesorhizobium sp.]|uniref:hypothetical protein n=1 Tax=Mesorhizobium sp. TaxID=1871066 RepID=UPI000FE96BF4|nr:hypothetical protein [Mesorhizobium sp.]RWP62738.1 MAG: hypothetical protein EOR08_13865 [Mesorhizobium sp.]TIL64081.1 MAG: hypothetical protein E5Y77_28535 [Mesorhizobium sp.]